MSEEINSTKVSNKADPQSLIDKFKSWRDYHTSFYFFGIIVFISVILMCIGQIYVSIQYKKSQERILQHYERLLSIKTDKTPTHRDIDAIIKNSNLALKDKLDLQLYTDAVINTVIDETLDRIEINKLSGFETEKLLEEIESCPSLQYDKLSNEYEAMQIWYGILTVIFLVFSFYSMFKVDDILRQGNESITSFRADALKEVEKQKKNAGEISKVIDTKITEANSIIDTKVADNLQPLLITIEEAKGMNQSLIQEIEAVNILLKQLETNKAILSASNPKEEDSKNE